jgi:hypothetical protein
VAESPASGKHPSGRRARRLSSDRSRRKEILPCPSDAAIMCAYGTHSFRPAPDAGVLEEQAPLVCQLDGLGRRIVTLVELGWSTTPGDPGAEGALVGNRTVEPSFG